MKKLLLLPLLAVLAAGCEITAPPPPLTPLEIQALQSRQYEQPKEIVFASVISVFQDVGYTIKSADKDTGFINAESASTSSYDWLNIIYSASTVATAFIEQLNPTTSQLRLNFVNQTQTPGGIYGEVLHDDKPLLDAETYQKVFERVEQAIFVRSK